MSEPRPDPRRRLANGEENVASPGPRLLRGLRTFLNDLRVTLRDPTLPTAIPALRDYPFRRR